MKRLVIVLIVAIAIAIGGIFIYSRVMVNHTGIENKEEAALKGNSKVLVVYFSWSGNVQKMARWISEETKGELFRIVPKKSYGTDYKKCTERAKDELDQKIRPEISSTISKEMLKKYDVIYLGFPIWWYDLPMPVWTFLEGADLQGKTIIPFFSHEGSSSGANSLNTLKDLAKGAHVLTDKALSIRGGKVSGSEDEIKKWAKML
jgi:flavodoxin